MAKRKVTMNRIMEAIESGDSTGLCLGCGAEAYGVEPDAHEYTCESCGQAKVYGAEELLMQLA